MTLQRSIADAHAMDRLNEGSWGNDPVGHGRLAAVVDFGLLDDILGKALYAVIPEMHYSRT